MRFTFLMVSGFFCCVSMACGETPQDVPTGPSTREALSETLEEQIKTYQLAPVVEARYENKAQVELGRQLFFDPILSGNKDVACATCHQVEHGLSNAVSLAAGTKASVVDGIRIPGERKAFTPRNVPDLFNRDQPGLRTMFWDLRLERLEDGQMVLYDKSEERRQGSYLRVMDERLESIIAAQTMLPVLNRDELRGHWGDEDVDGQLNLIAQVRDTDFETSWRLLFEQVWAVDAYRILIQQAYPNETALGFVHLSNALGAFIASTFTLVDSPWDRYLRGDRSALSDQALYGATVFFGEKAKCGQCHHGVMLSDQSVHNIGVRPMTRGPDHERGIDFGAQHRSHFGPEGRFAFRTPPLRNVELSAPYMHTGMYRTLEEVIAHKNDVFDAFWSYDPMGLDAPFRDQVHMSSQLIEPVMMSLAPQMQAPLALNDEEKQALIAFLKALTSPSAKQLTRVKPMQPLSGLALE